MKLGYVFPYLAMAALFLTGNLPRRAAKLADEDAGAASAHWASGREGDSGLVLRQALVGTSGVAGLYSH
jgi:hypothetical protein